ncbi:unnamed protein product [Adineta steineri]|uniref:Uncharacterized protein n=1 Tax=Adineta steineri TaxID=433720 RepID=A0A815RLG6_9BILA|nr:unnamed protein product [Adineta steineri]
MAGKMKKKFEACVLRTVADELNVVEWNRLLTTADKNKLGVGSPVGYKVLNKTIRGTILVVDVELPNESDDDEDDEASNDKDSSDLIDEASSESENDALEIAEEEEQSGDAHESQSIAPQQMKVSDEKNKNQLKKLKEIPSNNNNNNNNDEGQPVPNRLSQKRSLPDDEIGPPPKRTLISLARLQELEVEISRLKKQIEKFRREWMPRPTDPAIIRFFIFMGELFSSGGEGAEERGDKLLNACSILNVAEEDLKKWQKLNGTKTARTIVRAFYPPNTRANVITDDIDLNFRQAIHVNECERINEDSHQDQADSIGINVNDLSDSASDSLNDASSAIVSPSHYHSSLHSINCSPASFKSQAVDEPSISEDEPDTSSTHSDARARPIEKIDIAAALISIKTRHSLSAVCVNDICLLLKLLNVPNAPHSWFHVKQAFNNSSIVLLSRNQKWICSACKNASNDMFTCSNDSCKWLFAPPAPIPNYFYTFDILEQISLILATTDDLILPICTKRTHNSMLSMKDIVDGKSYRKILREETEPFLSLTISTDGVQPFNSAEKSIWPVTLVINEINRKKRFCFQNIILGGIWPGPSKPKRSDMSALLQSIVDQLKELEEGVTFECRINQTYTTQILKIFLICACMDEPAQSITQNLPEPIALYGCGRCEIRGQTVKSSHNSTNSVNCFTINNNLLDQPYLRTNDRYDQLLLIKQSNDTKIEKKSSRPLNRSQKRKLKKEIQKYKESEHGILGPCSLRQLKYFDRKLLCLWLEPKHKKQDWSCYSHLHQLSAMLQTLRFPSTTTRRPRSLNKFKKLKASELRVILLFGFVVFKNLLKSKYYDHFVKLVVAVHLSEFRAVTSTMTNNIKILLREFLVDFPNLYGIRYNQQVVHSLDHIGQTVIDYGPLTSYSTFHFENILGMIMRTIKSTRREEIEMIGNLNMFRYACIHLHDSTMNIKLKNYVEKMISGRGYHASIPNILRTMHRLPFVNRICEIFSNRSLQFFSTCKIGHVRFTSLHYSNSKVADDSVVLFNVDNEQHFGLINSIFCDEDNEILFELWPLSNANVFSVSTRGRNINLPSIQEGTLDNNKNYYYISPTNIIEKCVYWKQRSRKVIVFRYPNLEEGS